MPEEKPEVQETEGGRDYESEIRELRQEAAGRRVALREAEKLVESLKDQLKEREDAEKSEVTKLAEVKAELEKKVADMESAMKERDIRARVVSEAAKLNVVDPDTVYRLLDISTIDEDPASLKKALTSLLKEKPFLIKEAEPPTPGVGGRPIEGKPSTDQEWADLLKSGLKQ